MDNSGRDDRGNQEQGQTGDALQHYFAESWQAIDAIQQRETRTRRTRRLVVTGLVISLLIVVVVMLWQFVEITAPTDFSTETDVVAYLAVPSPAARTVRVFLPRGVADTSLRGRNLQAVMPLRVGEEVTVDGGLTALFFRTADDFRLEYLGPGNLIVTPEDVASTGGGGAPVTALPIAGWAATLAPLEDLDGPAPESGAPQPRYPVGVQTPTGSITLEWDYAGPADTVLVTIRQRAGEVIAEYEVPAGNHSLAVELDSGRGYRWEVSAAGTVSAAAEFRALADDEWDWIRTAARGCGMAGDDIVTEAVQAGSVCKLAALYTVLADNQLLREADAVRQRLLSLGAQ